MGFVVADRISTFWPRRFYVGSVVARLSYGGVLRHCPPCGGLVLILTLWLALCVFTLVGFTSQDWLVLSFLCGGVIIACDFASNAKRRSPFLSIHVALAGLILLLIVTPFSMWWSFFLFAGFYRFLLSFTMSADLVPGIPASLFAPLWLGAGALLIFAHQDGLGLVSVAMAGALWAVQSRHSFPPRWVLGQSGCVLAAGFTVVIGAVLLHYREYWAIIILSPYFLADAACSWKQGASAFEQARLRGEPERGLASASLALSCANLVLLWTLREQSWLMQALACGVSYLLAFQFRLFLVRRVAQPPARPPWLETGAPPHREK